MVNEHVNNRKGFSASKRARKMDKKNHFATKLNEEKITFTMVRTNLQLLLYRRLSITMGQKHF